MDSAWAWAIAALIALALLIALGWAQVRQRRATPRPVDVTWPVAIVLELTVIAAGVEDLRLAGLVYGGPPGVRLTESLLPAAAAGASGFAVSIALLALHRRRAPRNPASFLCRRIGVAAPGVAGFAALVAIPASITTELGRALSPAVLSALAGPALTVLLGAALMAYAISIALVPHQRDAKADTSDEQPTEAEDKVTAKTPASASDPDSRDFRAYQRPTP